MQPSDRDYDLLADRLNADLSSDEKQLEDLGAAVFSTAQLIEMRGRYLERLDNLAFWQKRLTRLAVWSPLGLVLGLGSLYLGVFRLGYFLLMGFPVILLVCLVGIFLLYQNCGSSGRIENWLEMIEEELQERYQKRKK